MSFVRNLWYVAAWSDEVQGKALVSRTLLGEHVLFFRNTAGELQAISDVCPHRLAPLHLGKHYGDAVACGYHGLRFDGSGQCVHNPHQAGKIPCALNIKSYSVHEQNRIIWIWMGAAEAADPSRIPDYSFVDRAAEHAVSKGYLHGKCNFELLSDNILDLSHVDFLHANTLSTGAIVGVKAKVSQQGDDVTVLWMSPDNAPSPLFDPYLPGTPGSPVDQWTEVVWHPPGVMTLEFGETRAGRPKEEGVNTMSLHLMTPETETTSHYFYLNSREFDPDNAEFNAMSGQFITNVFTTEDKPMIEGQQRYLGSSDLWAGNPVMLGIDAAAVQCRRILDRLRKAEAAVQ